MYIVQDRVRRRSPHPKYYAQLNDMQHQTQDRTIPHRGLGGQLTRSSASGWGKASSRLFSSTATTAAPTPVVGQPDSAFYAMPENSESTSTCRTSSPSPRIRDNPDSTDVEEPLDSYKAGWTSRRGNNPRNNEPIRDPSPNSWGSFCSPGVRINGGTGAGRELAQRTVTFTIFVVFRGGWCMSSGEFLQGEQGWQGRVLDRTYYFYIDTQVSFFSTKLLCTMIEIGCRMNVLVNLLGYCAAAHRAFVRLLPTLYLAYVVHGG